MSGDAASRTTIYEAAVATLAGTGYDPAISADGGFERAALGSNVMSCETADAAREIWCSEESALKAIVQCFVAIAAEASGALVEAGGQLMGPSDIFPERCFRFDMHEMVSLVGLVLQQQQAAVKMATGAYLDERQSDVRNCIHMLRRKQSLSSQSCFPPHGSD